MAEGLRRVAFVFGPVSVVVEFLELAGNIPGERVTLTRHGHGEDAAGNVTLQLQL